MKDKLEQFIEDNRDSFDSFDPSRASVLWEKIAGKKKQDQRGRVYLRYFSRAAGILLIFGLSYVFHDYVSHNRQAKIAGKRMNDLYEQVPELKEAENYYSSLVSNKLEEIKPFLAKNPAINRDVTTDLRELDSIYISMKNDLKDNVANDQVIEAMIQNYRLKLRILEELQAEVKHEKTTENAKSKTTI